MKQTVKYILPIACLMGALSLHAQTDTPQNLNREMTLEKEYDPNVRDANKINQLPEVKAPEAPKTKVEFSNYTLPYNLSPYLSVMKAGSYMTDLTASSKRGYANVGISSLLDINADLGYQILNSATSRLSIFGAHRSSNQTVKYNHHDDVDDNQMKINDNLLGIDFSHRFEAFTLSAEVDYLNSSYNYYGITSPEWNFIPGEYDDGKQTNRFFGSHLGVKSEGDADFNYAVNIGYTFMNQKYFSLSYDYPGRKEHRMVADFDLNAGLNGSTKLGLEGKVRRNFYVYDKRTMDLDDYGYNAFALTPYLDFEGGDWDARVGLSLNLLTENEDKNRFFVAPDAHFRWYPSSSFLFYLNAKGGIVDNSSYWAFQKNRYIYPRTKVLDGRSPLDATVGVDFTFMPNLKWGLFGGYQIINDDHFFDIEIDGLSEKGYLATLAPHYANGGTFKLGTNFQYAYQDMIDLRLGLTYYNWNKFDSTSDDYPWSYRFHRPDFTADLHVGFQLPEIPLRADLDYTAAFGRSIDIYGAKHNLKDIHQLNLKGTYALSDSFSFYLQLNNLLFQRYDLWYAMPASGFNAMIGGAIKF